MTEIGGVLREPPYSSANRAAASGLDAATVGNRILVSAKSQARSLRLILLRYRVVLSRRMEGFRLRLRLRLYRLNRVRH